MPAIKAIYWMLTIPEVTGWVPQVNDTLVWIKGQLEVGAGGYRHFQAVCGFTKQITLAQAKVHFPNESHLEKTRSQAADQYVWKEDTRVADT